MSASFPGIADELSLAPRSNFAPGSQAQHTLVSSEHSAYYGQSVVFLRGRNAIVAAQSMLAELAERTDQRGDADNLAHFLSTADALKKTPHLLLFSNKEAVDTSSGRQRELLTGAVLLFEYRIGRKGSHVFSTSDSTGRRNVFGPSESRSQLAALAARTLVNRHAQIVHIAYCETHAPAEAVPPAGTFGSMEAELETQSVGTRRIGADIRAATPPKHKGSWALLEHQIPLYLSLGPSFDATLARIGQRTRSNLRYYRRRSETDLRCSFVANVVITLADFLAFNRECTYAVSDAIATWRYNSLGTLFQVFLRGIRDSEGRWLSLVGGRKHGEFAEIDWQMNRGDLPSYSLSTVMRSYLLEYEIAAGSTRLYIEGGTPQPIRHSFTLGRVGELTFQRKSTYVRLMRRVALKFFPAKNYLAQVLRDPALRWRSW